MKKRYCITASTFDRRKRLISVGNNNYKKSHPLQKKFAELAGEPYKVCLHAEVLSLIRAGETKVYSMNITRFDASGNMKDAKPCLTCQEAIKAYEVQEVWYSTESGMQLLN